MVFIFFTLMAHRTTTVAPPPSLANVRGSFLLIDCSSPRLLLFLCALPDFHLHRRRHYHCLTKPIPLSPLLLSHFPYLSLYNPFITTFPFTTSAINDLVIPPSPTATRPNPLYDEKFSRDPGSRPSVWQVEIARLDFDNCPIYLLLLKDIIGCTDNRLNPNPSHSSTSGRFLYETSTDNDLEHPKLIAVHTLVSKSKL